MLYSIRSILELEAANAAFAQTLGGDELSPANTSKFAYISQRAFDRLFGDNEGGLQVLKLVCVPSGTVRYVAVAAPCECDDYAVYVPYSIYQELIVANATSAQTPKGGELTVANATSAQTPKGGELTTVSTAPRCTVTPVYDLEKATKIVLKPLDNAIYHSEMRDLLEEAMMDFPLLQKHTQFTIYIEKLGNYPVDIWVEDCEPAELVQLGGEVVVDFAEPLEEVAEWEPPPVVEPAPIATFEPAAPIPSFAPAGGLSFPMDNTFVPKAAEPPKLPTADEKERMRAARIAHYAAAPKPS